MKFFKLNKIELAVIGTLMFAFILVSIVKTAVDDRKINFLVGIQKVDVVDYVRIASSTSNARYPKKSKFQPDIISELTNNTEIGALSGSASSANPNSSFSSSGSSYGHLSKIENNASSFSGASGGMLLAASGRKSFSDETMNSAGASMTAQLPAFSPFAAPAMATSVSNITGGGDPGFAPMGQPLPVGDGIFISLLFAAAYFIYRRLD